jgi:glyoxylase-like metal-dependent hydrolase (beta-lactamase superfamily II)
MKRGIVLGAVIVFGAIPIAAKYAEPPQASKRAKIETMRPGGNLYVIRGDSNTAALITEEGVVLVDSQSAGWGQAILDALAFVTDLPVIAIINTHAHADHVGSNAEFAPTVEIVAHENMKRNMDRMDRFRGDARFLVQKTYRDHVSLQYGPDRIDLHYFGPGHTNGDTIVVFPALRVAHVGDLYAAKAPPVIDADNGGSALALPQTLAKAAAELRDVDRVIPGHMTAPTGPAGAVVPTWNEFQQYANFTSDFVSAIRAAIEAGKSVEEAVTGLRLRQRYRDYSLEGAEATARAIAEELNR